MPHPLARAGLTTADPIRLNRAGIGLLTERRGRSLDSRNPPRVRSVPTRPRAALLDLNGPERHRDRGLRRVDHGDAERVFQRLAMPRHAGAAHHDGAGAVLVA